jgi:hypothetical protein
MLSLSLGSGNWREEMWIEIFDRAKKRGKIVDTRLGEHEFQYALINPQDGYGRDRVSTFGQHYDYTGSTVTFWIKDAEKEGRVGLHEGGLAFVLERSLPRRDFADYIGLHEHAEAQYHPEGNVYVNDAEREVHGHGCKTELGEVLKRDNEFIDAYANWLVGSTKASKNPERGYFARAIPDFLDVIREGRLSPTKVLAEFKLQLDKGYHLHISAD